MSYDDQRCRRCRRALATASPDNAPGLLQVLLCRALDHVPAQAEHRDDQVVKDTTKKWLSLDVGSWIGDGVRNRYRRCNRRRLRESGGWA